MQDIPRGIYVRILSHPALGAVISFVLPVFGRDSPAAGASLRRELRVHGHQLSTGPCCLVASTWLLAHEMVVYDSPGLFTYASVESRFLPDVLSGLCHSSRGGARHVPDLKIFEGYQPEA